MGIPVSLGLDGKTFDILEENYQDVLPEEASGPACVRVGEIILGRRVVTPYAFLSSGHAV